MSNACFQDDSLIFSKNTVDDGDILITSKIIKDVLNRDSTPSPCSASSGYNDSDVESDGANGALVVSEALSKTLGTTIYDAKEQGSLAGVVSSVIGSGLENQSFLVCNLASVVRQLAQWKEELPMVDPFYAVKCNPDPVIVKLLASLGCSFDCATMGEIDLVSNHLGEHSFGPAGKTSTEIVYANPAKMEHMLDFAMKQKVQMTVFDGEDELYKIAKVAASAGGKYDFRLLLRITTDDKDSICRFSKKFGCPYMEAYHLLTVAKSLGLHVAGVSFHVGSGCGDAAAYNTALRHAAQIFQWGVELGMEPMDVIDIGGGFPGDTGGYGGPGLPTFQEIAAVVRSSIEEFCADIARPQSSVRFIAEPGRYFVSASTMTATKVYSRKGGNNAYQALYVDNGVYASFNTVVYDHAQPVPVKLTSVITGGAGIVRCSSVSSFSSTSGDDQSDECVSTEAGIPTAIFGPTCDGLDQLCSMENTLMERCQVGEWIIFDNQGAYTHTASFVFNGFTHVPNKVHCFLL